MSKKLLLLTVTLLIFAASLYAQEAPEVQKSLISKISATWCPPCGGWGWTFFHDLEEDNNDNALAIAVHHSGDLVNPTASAFTSNFGSNSQPRFILNNQDQSASSGNVATKRTEIQNSVNTNSNAAPVANTGIMASLENGVITVNTNTKFFQDATGDYYVGVYVVEDMVANFQATVGNDAIHTNILRGGLSTNAFGEEVSTGSVVAGTEFSKTFSIDVDADWNTDNITMATIIWKLENGTYSFVNTNSTDTFEDPLPSSINNIESADWNLQIQPTISTGDARVIVDLPSSTDNFELTIFNQIGQAVHTLHEGSLGNGLHNFSINTKLPKGIYLVRSRSGKAIDTRRMVIQ